MVLAPFAGYPLGLFNSLVAFLVAFAICGLGAGWVFGFIAIAAGLVTCVVAIGLVDTGLLAWLVEIGLLDTGSIDDGWAFILLVGIWGSGLFCITALVGASLRLFVLQRASVSESTED